MPVAQIEAILAANVSWPFFNVTKEQFFDLLSILTRDRAMLNDTVRVVNSVLTMLGVVCTILLIGSLWRKAKIEKNNFYISMLVVAFLDLVFNFFCFLHSVWYRMYKVVGCSSSVAMYFLLANRGLTYTLGLASDIYAVLLTFDRFLSIVKPQIHKKLLENPKKFQKVIIIFFVGLLSCTRFHYSLDKKIISTGSKYFYTPSEFGSTTFVTSLTTVGDVVLPFVLLIIMIILSTLFRLAVLNRQKKKNKVATKINTAENVRGVNNSCMTEPCNQTDQNQRLEIAPVEIAPQQPSQTVKVNVNQELRSIMVLTLCLDMLFILNQLACCCYFVVQSFLSAQHIFFDSSYEKVVALVVLIRANAYADSISTVVEVLSHILIFPLYMSLSKSMRKEFRSFFEKSFLACKQLLRL